jgi:hypothetical protein
VADVSYTYGVELAFTLVRYGFVLCIESRLLY